MGTYKLGVIGGMGSLATSIFFNRVINKTDANRDQDHIDMIILNHATMPDRTTAIMNNNKMDFLDSIKKDLEILNFSGVSNIVIPCNTSHYFYEDLIKMTDINIVHMIKSTVECIRKDYKPNSKIAVLATDGTIQSEVYKKELENNHMQVHDLRPELQTKIMQIIYQIKSGHTLHYSVFNEIIKELIFRDDCSCVILACTELSTIQLENDIKEYCIDALDVLVDESIRLSSKLMKL